MDTLYSRGRKLQEGQENLKSFGPLERLFIENPALVNQIAPKYAQQLWLEELRKRQLAQRELQTHQEWQDIQQGNVWDRVEYPRTLPEYFKHLNKFRM